MNGTHKAWTMVSIFENELALVENEHLPCS
jgi:hypothetical protein